MLFTDIHRIALRECSDAANLVAKSNIFLINHVNHDQTIYSDEIHHCVINGAFLRLFLAFEKYLESSFICYLCGQPGVNGTIITRCVSPSTEEHALKLIKGLNRHADFTNRDTIVKLANLFFENGGPYTTLNGISASFEEMKKIRNAITHTSIESEQAFNGLVRSKMGSLPQGMNTAIFLNSIDPQTSNTYFINYKRIAETTINSISNPTV